MTAALRHIFLASLARRRLASLLSLLAIALGVALGLSVQLIHGAALDEFGRGMRLLAGEADLQVLGGREGFDDALYLALAQRPEVAHASPIVEVQAAIPGRDETLRVLGIDLFRAVQVHPGLIPVADDREAGGPFAALAEDALFLSAAAQSALGMQAGDRLELRAGVRSQALRIAGAVPGAGVGQALGVMDIAAAQKVFDRIGRLSRVDLRLAEGVDRGAAQKGLEGLLPAGVVLVAPEAEQSSALGLSRAYRVNLTMLAVIALVTGGFLVFSTQLLSVVRRRQELAFLRALGVDRRMLMRGLMVEGAAVGLAGGLCGVALGYGLTALAFTFVGGDLGAGFFAEVQPELRFAPGASLGYLGFGVLAGMAGAWLPAREAARLVPARALRAGGDSEVLKAAPRWRATLMSIAAAGLLCLLPPVRGVPVFGYAAVAMVLVAAVLALPGVSQAIRGMPDRSGSVILRLARARLASAPGQAVVAGAAVVASVALAVSMAIMVSSFRNSVDHWLTQVLPADLYVRAASAASTGFLPPELATRIAAQPGVASAAPIRYDTLRLTAERLPVTLIARPVTGGFGLPLVAGEGPSASGGEKLAWVSEAMADLFSVEIGEELTLPLGSTAHAFRVAGIWRDYARQTGAVVIDILDYRALTGDMRSNDLAIYLASGADTDAVIVSIREATQMHPVEISHPGEIRATTLEIFDRTFLVTYLMEAVAVMIGLFGISTSFAALVTARRKEFGMLRHLGVTRGEIGRLLALEGAMTAAVGVAVGMIAGGAVAVILVEVINRQSFHWSMELHWPVWGLLAFAGSMILLAALAARISGYQAMRQGAVLAVREDW